MKLFTTLLIILLPALALAAQSESTAAVEHVPHVVYYQILNLGILIAGLVYFTKDMIVQFFAGRKSAYLEAAQKSAFAREAAEREFVDVQNKLQQLEKNHEQSLHKAHIHAEELKKQILAEGVDVSRRVREEAHLTAQLEVQRARRDLREQLLTDSVTAARMILTKDIAAADQQKLQNEFIKNIEVAPR